LKKESIILLVEDEVSLGQTLKELLMVEGHQVHLSLNGLEALVLLEKIKPDIIISDIMMPKMDGFELLRELRKSSNTESIPVLLLSARAELEDKLAGVDLGADGYITKPFNSWELLSSVENIINSRNEFSHNSLSRPQKKVISNEDEIFLRKLKTILGDTISENIKINEMANILNLSESEFQIKVKEISNKSASEFIENYKLHKAKELLDNKAANVSEAARATGFSSPSYFSTCYKKLFGHAPSQQF